MVCPHCQQPIEAPVTRLRRARRVTPKIPRPHCGGYYSKVVDVRPTAAGVFRRRSG
jgi:hypothetical protein